MAAVYLYCDESGKFSIADFTSFCGYIGNAAEWDRFSEAWNNLRLSWRIPPIHMSAVMSPERNRAWLGIKTQWGSDWEKKRDQMLAEFASLVSKHKVLCVGAVIDSQHFRAMPPSDFKRKVADPHYLAFQYVVGESVDSVRWIGDDALGLVLDDDEQSSMVCYSLLQRMRNQEREIAERISGICFVEDSRYPGVQAADMIAYESRRLMFERLSNQNVQPSGIFVELTRGLEAQPTLFTAAILDEMASEKPAR